LGTAIDEIHGAPIRGGCQEERAVFLFGRTAHEDCIYEFSGRVSLGGLLQGNVLSRVSGVPDGIQTRSGPSVPSAALVFN